MLKEKVTDQSQEILKLKLLNENLQREIEDLKNHFKMV